jgi:hypothetical protein
VRRRLRAETASAVVQMTDKDIKKIDATLEAPTSRNERLRSRGCELQKLEYFRGSTKHAGRIPPRMTPAGPPEEGFHI